ncbi:hypothetical protein CEXT_483511 [Caerostris extrusa]|uniref:Uncharacterized protein n=1 Tax=Caerostris extrusa TaxID=172846 RepID=A0AAV4VFH5_CAEEX|nr:hypothetical protein CEXT_483511 [Caerostris extrusa]
MISKWPINRDVMPFTSAMIHFLYLKVQTMSRKPSTYNAFTPTQIAGSQDPVYDMDDSIFVGISALKSGELFASTRRPKKNNKYFISLNIIN